MADRLRVGMVGVGGMGSAHVGALDKRQDCELVAVCDAVEEVLKPFQKRQVPTFVDAQAMFKKVPMEVVIVTLPHDLYPPVICAAMDRGIHVLKEKPLARNLTDALAMLAKSQQTGCRLLVFGQRKSDPYYLKMRSLIQEGAIGQVHMLHAAIFYYWTPASEGRFAWRGIRERSGGIAIIDSGFHILDVVQQIMGTPETVYAETGESLHAFPNVDYDIDDRAAMILKYASGAFANVLSSYAVQPSQSYIEAYGTTGALIWKENSLTHYAVKGECETIKVESEAKSAVERQLDLCLSAVQTGEPSIFDVEKAIDVQRTIEAAYQSAREGRPVQVSVGR